MSSPGPERRLPEAAAITEATGSQSATALLDQDFGTYMPGIHQRMSEQVAKLLTSIPLDSEFHDMFHHVFGGDVSYKRSALVYIMADTFGEDRGNLDRLALASEEVQTASLMVDDWHDRSSKRRNQTAAHIRFGPERAVNGAFAIAFDAFGEMGTIEAEAGLEAGKLTRYISRIMGSRGMCLGQAEDMEAAEQGPWDMTLGRLNGIAHRKTGLAMEMAIVGAARVIRVPRRQVVRLEDYARHFGIAYQIKDDLEDVVPDTDGSNYAAVIGAEAAEAELQRQREKAEAALDRLTPDVNTIKFEQILAHVVGPKPEPGLIKA